MPATAAAFATKRPCLSNSPVSVPINSPFSLNLPTLALFTPPMTAPLHVGAPPFE